MSNQHQNKFIGDKIRKFRKLKRLSQEELALKIGVKHNTISAYERGVIEITHSKLLEVAKVLDVKYTQLLPLEETDALEIKRSLADYLVAEKNLSQEQSNFLEALIEKTQSLDESERESFLKNIRFAVEFFQK